MNKRDRNRQTRFAAAIEADNAERLASHPGLNFSLSCTTCDAGTEVKTRGEAEAAGWSQLLCDPGGISWTWLGLCPECGTLDMES